MLDAQKLALLAIFGVLSASVFACSTKEDAGSSGTKSSKSSGDDDDDDDSTSNKTGSSTTTTESYCCGYNDEYWDCPTSKAFEKCTDFSNYDPSECTARSNACKE